MDKGAPSAEWSLAARRPVSCGRGSPRRGTPRRTFPRKRGKLPSPNRALGLCLVLVPGQRPIEWSQRRLLLALPALPFALLLPYFHLFSLLAWKHRLCSYERRGAPGPRRGPLPRPIPTETHTRAHYTPRAGFPSALLGLRAWVRHAFRAVVDAAKAKARTLKPRVGVSRPEGCPRRW